jgi:hypothetical protein
MLPRGVLLCALASALGACGDEGDVRARSLRPDPCAALAANLLAVGATLPVAENDRVHEEASACLRRALETGDPAGAQRAYLVLDRWFGGSARAGGRLLGRPAVAGAVLDAALERARADLVEPLLSMAEALVPATEDAEAPARLARARTWVRLARRGDLPRLPPHEGPEVVLYADDFHLGETLLLSVLGRWAREGAAGGLRVTVVPLARGIVRHGMRRVPAPQAEERAAVEARVAGTGLGLAPASLPAGEAGGRLGLEAEAAAVFVLDRAGAIRGRLSSPIPDPRALDEVVQRVGSR